MTYKVVLHRDEEGYSVSCPGLPGCWSQGETEEAALTNIRDAICGTARRAYSDGRIAMSVDDAAGVRMLAEEAFGDAAKAKTWLSRPNVLLAAVFRRMCSTRLMTTER